MALLAPNETPSEITSRMASEISKAVRTSRIKSVMERSGTVPVGSTPAELEKFINDEIIQWGKVIKAAKISIDN